MSQHRILTTHVGSLPRPQELFELLIAEDRGEAMDIERLRALTTRSVADIVRQQIECGIDIVSDGELSKSSYTHYVKHRLTGIASVVQTAGGPPPHVPRDMRDHPDLMAANAGGRGTARNLLAPLICEGPVAYRDGAPLQRDLANLKAAIGGNSPARPFMTSASPGTLAHFIRNGHYASEDAFLSDLAEAMRPEYEAIAAAGVMLQIDCPDLAMSRHITYQALSDAEFVRVAERNVAALNHATRNIPPAKMRMHVCWGNYPGPHTHDIPVDRIAATIMKARPGAVLFEAANPRHEHEWEDWKKVTIPSDKVLIPGVIDSTTNLVEHPRLVAQLIGHYVAIVGPERVIAGTDCGFGTVAGRDVVAPSVVFAKLRALTEGARLASATATAA